MLTMVNLAILMFQLIFEAKRSASEWLVVQHSVEAIAFHLHLLH